MLHTPQFSHLRHFDPQTLLVSKRWKDRKVMSKHARLPSQSDAWSYQSPCPGCQSPELLETEPSLSRFPTPPHDILPRPPPTYQVPDLLLPQPAPLAQTSIPEGPASGRVPSSLEAHPSIWLIPTEERADTVQGNT